MNQKSVIYLENREGKSDNPYDKSDDGEIFEQIATDLEKIITQLEPIIKNVFENYKK